MRIYISFLLLICVSCTAHTQDLAADMKFMHDLLKNPTSLHVQVEATITTTDDDGKEEQTKERTEIKISQGKYLYVSSDHEMLINRNHIVLVQKKEKEILYSRNDGAYVQKQQAASAQLQYMPKPEVNDEIKFHGIEGGLKHYTITNSKGVIERAGLWFDAATGILKKTVYEYSPESPLGGIRVASEFKLIDPKATFDDTDFLESRYVTISGTAITVAPAFKSYTLTHIDVEP